jgi:hypothetical protein
MADRQAQAQAVRLGRIEGVEQLVDVPRLESGARIAHRDHHVRGGFAPRTDPQLARARPDATHGLICPDQRHVPGEVRL